MLELKTFADADFRPRKPLVTCEDGYFVVQISPDSVYEIPVRHAASRDEILRWMRQVAEKTWFTREHMLDFVRCAINKFGIFG